MHIVENPVKIKTTFKVVSTIKLSTLNHMIETKSPDIPRSIRVRGWSFEWTGGVWVRDKAKDTDVILLETE